MLSCELKYERRTRSAHTIVYAHTHHVPEVHLATGNAEPKHARCKHALCQIRYAPDVRLHKPDDMCTVPRRQSFHAAHHRAIETLAQHTRSLTTIVRLRDCSVCEIARHTGHAPPSPGAACHAADQAVTAGKALHAHTT